MVFLADLLRSLKLKMDKRVTVPLDGGVCFVENSARLKSAAVTFRIMLFDEEIVKHLKMLKDLNCIRLLRLKIFVCPELKLHYVSHTAYRQVTMPDTLPMHKCLHVFNHSCPG
jgi:hypothetical protein